jgi:phosphatidate cytidylyltransferase|tara:strand:- start:627 stop:1289 length:663 start_codon:yes stop_codon:yes gene_type:complete
MSLELKKRIITSIFLLSLLTLMFLYSFVMFISLIIIALISWIEFYALISKIIIKKDKKDQFLRFLYKSLSLFYLSGLVFLILIIESNYNYLKLFLFYSVLVSIFSDIGGLTFGKFFKGKKLSYISPNKTVSGSIGSFICSLSLLPIFLQYLIEFNIIKLILITLVISLTTQVGDLFISYLKRKAKVKDTSDILPGHGGVLDRIDGIIFAIPIGVFLLNSL